MKRKKMKMIASVLGMLVLLISMTVVSYAAQYSVEVENNIDLGLINISLEQFEYDKDKKLTPCDSFKEVGPGEQVNRVLRITNTANSAWIRLKLAFKNDQHLVGVDESMLTSKNRDWKKIGDYYYWTKPIEKGAAVYFDNSILVPAEWTNDDSYKLFKISVSADAVQSKNFSPDFQSKDPWFGTVIEQSLYDTYDERTVSGHSNFQVLFKGGAEGLVKIGDDFFSNWSTMMPGDLYSDKAEISSNYEQPVKIWFYTRTDVLNQQTDLADRIVITIKNNDTELYHGPLSGTVNKTLLGEYTKGLSGTLSYSVYIPKELTNKYSLSNAKTIWVFECETPESGGKRTGPVQTGDVINLLPYISIIIAALCLLYVLRNKQQRKEL